MRTLRAGPWPHGGRALAGSVARRFGVRHGRAHQSTYVNIDTRGKRIVTRDIFQMASVSSTPFPYLLLCSFLSSVFMLLIPWSIYPLPHPSPWFLAWQVPLLHFQAVPRVALKAKPGHSKTCQARGSLCLCLPCLVPGADRGGSAYPPVSAR